MVYSCKKFRHYLICYEFVFHVDHYALQHLVKKADLSGRIARWVLLLQEFTYTVQTRKGVHHENADYLSRLWTQPTEEELVDDFPDEELFQLSAGHESRYADLYRYLLTLQCPVGMDLEQRTVFIHKAGPYQLQQGVLFKKMADERLCRCLEESEVPRVVRLVETSETEAPTESWPKQKARRLVLPASSAETARAAGEKGSPSSEKDGTARMAEGSADLPTPSAEVRRPSGQEQQRAARMSVPPTHRRLPADGDSPTHRQDSPPVQRRKGKEPAEDPPSAQGPSGRGPRPRREIRRKV
ncbi:hypothetical protein AXG93_3671s1200 [Marchantia polymorpha subsp. ruderalis]|uniref:Reverse transcriptase RNase H-like domain-containing protein n=1 Tax=Marchantia polymorpha subsp. ruderalis TaxID=1480154 RepID=A0A176WII1_MARPO|nr:hypothetical protein AXG93_3671s1200 [Marchantia polymorpha subsp. ruderalis]